MVQFHIYFGLQNPPAEVDVELYDQDKPVTVQNFLRLVNAGAYNGSFFHRCVPGFVLQGGGYSAVNPFLTSTIAPNNYTNLFLVGNFGNITNEINVGKFYSNTNWTIAMAKASDPNSANSQFFFNLANNASLLDNTNNAGGFTVFGHALSGTNLLNFFNTLVPGVGLFDLSQNYGGEGSIFPQLPADFAGTTPPPYYDLCYFAITLMNTQLTIQTNGTRQIAWNSSAGVTNTVQYTTNLSANWQALTNVVGNGGVMSVTDTTTNKMRFYRVMVSY